MPSVQLDRDYQVVLLTLEGEGPSRLIKAYDTVFDFDTALALLNSGEKVFPIHWPYSPLNGWPHWATKTSEGKYKVYDTEVCASWLASLLGGFNFMLIAPSDVDKLTSEDNKLEQIREEVTGGS